MALPTDANYITGTVPPEMREGVDVAELGLEAGVSVTHEPGEGDTPSLTRISIPRPTHIPPANPNAMPPGYEFKPLHTLTVAPPAGVLTYAFALLPGVQAHITLMGEPTADHLEQLVDYLTVACKRLREQEARNTKGRDAHKSGQTERLNNATGGVETSASPAPKRRRKHTAEGDDSGPGPEPKATSGIQLEARRNPRRTRDDS